MKKGLPRVIYVKEVADGDDKYLDAAYTLEEAAEDEVIMVGMYELRMTKKITKVVKVL